MNEKGKTGGWVPDLRKGEKFVDSEKVAKQIESLKSELDKRIGQGTYKINERGEVAVERVKVDSEIIEEALNDIEPQLISWYAEKNRLEKLEEKKK